MYLYILLLMIQQSEQIESFNEKIVGVIQDIIDKFSCINNYYTYFNS